jgi:hypothetical protein
MPESTTVLLLREWIERLISERTGLRQLADTLLAENLTLKGLPASTVLEDEDYRPIMLGWVRIVDGLAVEWLPQRPNDDEWVAVGQATASLVTSFIMQYNQWYEENNKFPPPTPNQKGGEHE